MNENVKFLELNKENLFSFIEEKNINFLKDIDNIEELLDKEVLKNLNLLQGIIYNYDSVNFGNIEDLDIDIDNIIEGRFFNETSEISIRIENDEVIGNIVYDNGDEKSYIEGKFLIYDKNNKNTFEELLVKKYINYDKDNQAYIEYIKPTKLK
ncbi:MAG: hypothetical protein ACI33J_03275 [Clostridium sp.]